MPGLKVNQKDALMPPEMEETITDTIIIAKVKNGGDAVKMADAIRKKLNEHFGGMWTVLVVNNKSINNWSIIGIQRQNGTFINVDHGAHTYVIFKS